MPLDISNKHHLSQPEINALASCNLSYEILAIKVDGKDYGRIVKLSRDEVTYWQLFLRYFGCGKLAHLKIHLAEVASHLNQFNWKKAKSKIADEPEFNNAFEKVCQLANKALLRKGDDTLFRNVSTVIVEKRIDTTMFIDSRPRGRHTGVVDIDWNPFLQVKHLRAYLQLHHRGSTIRIEDKNHQVLTKETNLPISTLKTVNIFMERHYRSHEMSTERSVDLHSDKPKPSALKRRPSEAL